MRKYGGLFFVAVLLLLAPSLANAWTLYVKASGGSSDGTIYIQDTSKNGVIDPADSTTYVAKLSGGPKYVQLTGAAIATVVLKENIAATVLVDYVAATVTADVVVDPIATTDTQTSYDIPVGKGSLTVAWGQAASAQGDVTVVKEPGGSTLVQYIGLNTMTGYTGLAFGASVGIKANPRSDYRVSTIFVADVANGDTASYVQDGKAGEAKTIGLTIASTKYEVYASYELVPFAKAFLSAPLRAVVGSTVVLNANGTTSNTDITYSFSVSGAQTVSRPAGDLSFFSFEATTAGTLTATLTVYDDFNNLLATKTANIEVVSVSTQANTLCLGCHTGSTPAIVEDYLTGTLSGTKSCVDCHTEAPHNNFDSNAGAGGFDHGTGELLADHNFADDPSSVSCSACHPEIINNFATSLHNTVAGKATFYNNNMGVVDAEPLQKGFGNYVNTDYADLPCARCHNAAAWEVAGVDSWPGGFGQHVCTDCHGNRANDGSGTTTSVSEPVTKETCLGCHTRQKTEQEMGLTDVHETAGMGCAACHSTSDMHGNGTAYASLLAPGAISAQCENCHGTGTSQGALSTTPAHIQHQGDIACSTCHMESVITCYNCHFDNEASDPTDATILHAKFASAKFGGTKASGNAWRFLVNRVMADGSTKVYPASMQSLVADRTALNAPDENDLGWTHAAIAPYYSHSITRVNALSCDECHGIRNAIDLAAGTAIDVVRWNAGVWTPPQGVIPVPADAVNLLNMDFVDLVEPAAPLDVTTGSSSSARQLFKDRLDSIHMPSAYVTPLSNAQLQALATPQ